MANFSEMKTLEEMNSPGKQPDAAPVEHPDKVNHCSDAGASQTARQLENENNAADSLADTLSTPASLVPHLDVKPVTKKRVAFITVGNPKVIATHVETRSPEVNKKQRFDMVPDTAESGDLYRKFMDSESANNSLF
jgi:hypothetical protein